MRLLLFFVGLFFIRLFFVSAVSSAHVVDKADVKKMAKEYEIAVRECLQINKQLDAVMARCRKTVEDLLGREQYKKLLDSRDVRRDTEYALFERSYESRRAWRSACKSSSEASIKNAWNSRDKIFKKIDKKDQELDDALGLQYSRAMKRARTIDRQNRIVFAQIGAMSSFASLTQDDEPWYLVGHPFGGTVKQWKSMNVEEDILRARRSSSPSVQALRELQKKSDELYDSIKNEACGANSKDASVRSAYIKMKRFEGCESYPNKLDSCKHKVKTAQEKYRQAIALYAEENPLEDAGAAFAVPAEAGRVAQ